MQSQLSKFEEVLRDKLGEGWFEFIKEDLRKQYFIDLAKKVAEERKIYTVYPDRDDVFKAFKLTPLESLKVIILGQDPYHDGNASGLAFGSLGKNPSLKKILDQLEFYQEFGDFEVNPQREPSLEYLATQGVLLLNKVLTVRRYKANSHKGLGWEKFTNTIVARISRQRKGTVFMLWGADAKDSAKYLDYNGNLILVSEHPAAACYSERPWHDMQCFQRANEYLESLGKEKVKW